MHTAFLWLGREGMWLVVVDPEPLVHPSGPAELQVVMTRLHHSGICK